MPQLRDDLLLEKISEKIKSLRKAKGVTLEEFFNDTNIHLSRVEHSKANITVSTLKHICTYFNISLHDFFKDIDR